MKQRLMKLSIALLIPMTILAVLLVFGTTTGASTAANIDTAQPAPDNGDSPYPEIVARRLTSIPFGIDSFLPLSHDGQVVQVSGHGECPTDGENFDIRVTVTQNGHTSRAIGTTAADCDTLPGWSATARTPGKHALTPGPAEACGHVNIFGVPQGTLVGKWCKNVTLE